MSKRTWTQSNADSMPSVNGTSASPMSPKAQSRHARNSSDTQSFQPSISRKIRACAACRKQKIKCIMDDRGPPCKRCAERGLSCVLNKSLQTLIDERSQWKSTVSSDLGQMHSALQDVLSRLSLPSLPPLQTTAQGSREGSPQDQIDGSTREDGGPSVENSPRIMPKLEHHPPVPTLPIDSLYEITRLKALRSDDTTDFPHLTSGTSSGQAIDDFIANGQLAMEDAERLFDLYLNRLDHFIYMVGGKYRDLESLRRGSAVLTACICTVAALHDPLSKSHIYGVCNQEFRRLISVSMFDRRIDRDHLRAMCLGAYWLSDISWALSGFALRRATEVNLCTNYGRALHDQDEEAMDCMRLWYLLYICDNHLAILYGRPSIVKKDESIKGWENLMKTYLITECDKRMLSQVGMLIILSNARELFGLDTGAPIPQALGQQIFNFSCQIDQWAEFWNHNLQTNEFIGDFPKCGIILHRNLAKLHLHSHVFRGLKGSALPHYFLDSAVTAVTAARSTVECLINEPCLFEALRGIPHYLHTMIAFACVFLLKVATQHPGQFIEDAVVFDLTTKLVHQFRSTAVGKWHLVLLMADGIEKMMSEKTGSPSGFPTLATLGAGTTSQTIESMYQSHAQRDGMAPMDADGVAGPSLIYHQPMMMNGMHEARMPGFTTTPFLHFDGGGLGMNYPNFGGL